MICEPHKRKVAPRSTVKNITEGVAVVDPQTMCITWTDCECQCECVSVTLRHKNSSCVSQGCIEMQNTFPQCGSRPGNVIEAVLARQRAQYTPSQRSARLLCVSPYTSPICPVLYSACSQILIFTLRHNDKLHTFDWGLRVQEIKLNFTPLRNERLVSYSSTFLVDGGGLSKARSRPLHPGGKHANYCKGRWMALRVCLDWCGKSCPHRDSILELSFP